MSFNRIQKLLFAEYQDFEDMVLVESPFAQTTRNGEGVRQVHLGLTPTKLVLATDILPPADAHPNNVYYKPNVNPIIETLELVSIYPINCVNLSVYRKRKRQTLKSHFCNNYITYFELGGFEKRRMFWNLWCERVKFLNPNENKFSSSDSCLSTSTSKSELCVVKSKYKLNENGKPQFWLQYASGDNTEISPHLENIPKDVQIRFDILPTKMQHNNMEKSLSNTSKTRSTNGGGENITSLSTITEDISYKKSIISFNSDVEKTAEDAVQYWEDTCSKSNFRGRYPRRYGITPLPHFLFGLGPWNLHTGDRFSVQRKRAVSAVRIRQNPEQFNLCLPISKKLLTTSISCEGFHMDISLTNNGILNKLSCPEKPLLYFWTPEYWYRPQSTIKSYNEYLQHFNKIRSNLGKKRKIFSFSRKRQNRKCFQKLYDNSFNFSRTKSIQSISQYDAENYMNSIQILRHELKLNIAYRALDFDSTRLAYELTMIDKELFLKIPEHELESLQSQYNLKNIPNISTFIAFSNRVSCLVATEVLREDILDTRVRIMIRFINVASKCERLNNFHSCITILNGLQSPSVYRLHKTWAYLRKYHSMKYVLFQSLCQTLNDPRLPKYQKAFHKVYKNPPYLPSIGDIFVRLYGKATISKNNDMSEVMNYNYNTIFPTNTFTTNLTNMKQIYGKPVNRKPICSETTKLKNNQKSFMNYLSTKFKAIKKDKSNITKHEIKYNHNYESKERFKNNFLFTNTKDDREKLYYTILFLRKSQNSATKYVLSEDEMTREYLLKARYREDRENFVNSFKLER